MKIYTSTYITWYRDGCESLVGSIPVEPLTESVNPNADDFLVVWQPNDLDEMRKIVNVIERFSYDKRVLIHYEGRYKRPHGYSVRYQQLFGRIYTNTSTDIDNITIKYLPVAVWVDPLHDPIFKRTKSICSVVTNAYLDGEARGCIIRKLLDNGVDIYGSGYKQIPGDEPRNYNAKLKLLSKYIFCFACENQLELGHLTEKPFDAIAAGCIPIYLGPIDANAFIPKECYIDFRDFWSVGDMLKYVRNMSMAQISEYQSAVAKNRKRLVGMRRFQNLVRYICKDLGFECESPYHE
ncbi:MAG: glycosyltransferase family 10, partial [Candidatus Cloacimonetes bacterium]|nr:glycosyltransferase family 10 [Candidatus Cloacimonadota bacterium]